MGSQEKTVSSVNEKIRRREAVVLTETELMEEVQTGRTLTAADVDVVTTAFQVETSGTAAIMDVPVAERGTFTRARKIWLNGVPGYPGPAPNERLGLVEALFFASQRSEDERGNYSGAELISDVIRRREIQVRCVSVEGQTFESSFRLEQADFARMYVYNCFFRNLCAGEQGLSTDWHLKVIKAGTKILLNRATGIVIGCGTRSKREHRSLSLSANIFEMDPEALHEQESEGGKTLTNLAALALPVLDEDILRGLTGCAKLQKAQGFAERCHGSERNTAQYLKQLITRGEFLLISSDMGLNNWS